MAIVGLGVGAASRGLRPVVDIMFMDFLAVCLDQVVNQAAKMKFMFGGEVRVPLVITVASGAGLGAGAQHSQSLEAWLAHTPGLKVAMPSSAYDAKGLMVTAVRDDNPVIMMLNKKLLGREGRGAGGGLRDPVRAGQHPAPRGHDVTVVALGRMAVEAAAAADELAAEGIGVEVIDPRTVQPLDTDTIVASARQAPTASSSCTRRSRSAASAPRSPPRCRTLAFDHLDAPVLRIGAPFAPVPFSPALENAYVPDRRTIATGCRRILKRG